MQARLTDDLISPNSLSQHGFVSLFVAYVISAVLIIDFPLMGYGVMAAILGTWVAYTVVSHSTLLAVPRASMWLALGMFGAIGLSSLAWEPGVDFKDVIGLYTFFVVVPSIYVALNDTFGGVERYVCRAFKYVFFATTGIVVLDIVVNGFSVYRASIFGINKNGVSSFFEVMYAYLLFDSRNRSSAWTATVILVGYSTLIMIFSKTSIGFGFIFTVGYFSSVLFYLSGIAVAVVGVSLMLSSDPASLLVLRTAVDRFLLWQDAFLEITSSAQRLFLGFGPGNYFSEVREFGLYAKRSIHNYYLQIAHGFGIVTLSVILTFFAWIFKRFGVLTSGAVAAFWMFNLHATFDVGWVTGPGFLASLMLGLILARNHDEGKT